MITPSSDSHLDRLYELLPAIYRMRDADARYPLRALLRVIAEQVAVVEDDITQLYDNWFIETCEDWVVPYIGALVGYQPLPGGETESHALERIRVPRREVANVIRYRRRKGAVALLELVAGDVAGWPARAVEFFRLLGWHQHINHPHLDRARLVDLRDMDALDRIDGPFDSIAHRVDVRRIVSSRTRGRFNIPSVGVFVWRLKSYSVTGMPAYCAEDAGPHCITFSVLGQDAPLFIHPRPESDPTRVAGELNVPAPIRRQALVHRKPELYGPDASFAIWADGWAGLEADQPIPHAWIIPADLSGWEYVPPLKHVAVDPVLGRMAFPPAQLPRRGVRVTYHYGFSADMGGGEYDRPILDPVSPTGHAIATYRVGRTQTFHKITDAVAQWQTDQPKEAIIELTDSAVYAEPFAITLADDQSLQIRAANRKRPVIRLLDWQADLPDALGITMGTGSRITLDGLLITGRPLVLTGPAREASPPALPDACGSEVVIRHCTLVPGWGLDCDCEPRHPSEPSVQVYNLRASLRIEHTILGPIQVSEDEVRSDPIAIAITDSILDATDPARQAIGAPPEDIAHAILTIRRSTVFGIIDLHAIDLAENSIFMGCVNVARRQRGCVRFCYVPEGCRTPRRHRCQPDLVVQAVIAAAGANAPAASALESERLRVRPLFTSRRYGNPGYAQLGEGCAIEIVTGADDGSEMGAFHDLFQPQRAANLRARLDEYTPAGMDVGVIYAS